MNYAFGILPTIIRQDSRVSDFACRLFSEVDSLSNKFGYCFATNSALAKSLGKSPSQISRTLSELEALNYITLVIEDGYKRKIYPKRDFREFEGVDENAEGGTQNCVGGYADLQRGVRKNSNHNKIIKKDKPNKIKEEGEAQYLFKKEIEELQKQYDALPKIDTQEAFEKIKQLDSEIKALKATEEKERKSSAKKKEAELTAEMVKEVVDYLNEKAGTSFKATTKETVQFINGRQKQDGWALEDFKAVIDFKVDQWGRDDKMTQYICPSTLFRASNAEKYLQAAKSWQEGKKTAPNGQIYTREEQAPKLVYDRVLPKPKLNKV